MKRNEEDKDWEALKLHFNGEPLDEDQEQRVIAIVGHETSNTEVTLMLVLLLFVVIYAMMWR